jgi:hypothetical protein
MAGCEMHWVGLWFQYSLVNLWVSYRQYVDAMAALRGKFQYSLVRVERGQNHVPFFVTYVPFKCNAGGRKRNLCEMTCRFLLRTFRLV